MTFLARILLGLTLSLSLVYVPISHAQIKMISTDVAVAQMSRTQSEAQVTQLLNRGAVQEQLVKLGISPAEASTRLASLSDAEVKDLSHDIQQASAGGDVGGILVLVLVIILIIYFVKRI